MLEFVDLHGNDVLSLGSFTLLPQHVVRLILSRDELKAEELTKFQAALNWSKRYCDGSQGANLKEVMATFLEYIEFHKIPAGILMKEVHPLMLVPDQLIMNALAYQADPNSVDISKLGGSPNRMRRNTQRSLSVQESHDLLNSSSTTLSSYTSSDVDSGRTSNSEISPHIDLRGQQEICNE